MFPVLVAILATKAVRRRRDLGGAIAIVMLTAMLTPVVASSLTDGLEGSRMRFPTSFLVVVGVWRLLSPGPTDSGERGAVAGERPG